MGQMSITTRVEKMRLGKREQLIILEVGRDSIDSASAFVDYITESYGYSKSSIWYNLNRLKELGLADFATKEEPGKVLMLTRDGLRELQSLERSGIRISDFEAGAQETAPVPDNVYLSAWSQRNNLIVGRAVAGM